MVTVEKIVEIIAGSGGIKNIEAFDPEKSFKDNGVDSLDVYTILLAVEEGLGVAFTDEETDRIRSVADVAKILSSR